MKEKFNDRPVLPEPRRQDLVIKNVPSEIVNLLKDWLKEEAQQENNRTSTDIFVGVAKEVLYRKLGTDGYRERYVNYQEEQQTRLSEYLEYCKKADIDPDEDPALNHLYL